MMVKYQKDKLMVMADSFTIKININSTEGGSIQSQKQVTSLFPETRLISSFLISRKIVQRFSTRMIKFIMDSSIPRHSYLMESESVTFQMDQHIMDNFWMVGCTEKVFSNGLPGLENSLKFTMVNTNMDSKVEMENLLSDRVIFTKVSGNKVEDMERELWSIKMGFRFRTDIGIKANILGSHGYKTRLHE